MEILSELSRAQDTSQYIKSVYTAEGGWTAPPWSNWSWRATQMCSSGSTQEPGSIVIRLTPAENRLDTIYSLRTSVGGQPGGPQAMAAPEEGRACCRDDAGRLFVELGQYDTREKAERAAGDRGGGGPDRGAAHRQQRAGLL